MSKFVVYIKVEPFVKQWLVHSFGNPVVFPAQSIENSTIRRFTQKQPAAVPEPPDEEDVAIAIPDSKAKDPLRFFRSFVGWPFSNIKLSTSSFSFKRLKINSFVI